MPMHMSTRGRYGVRLMVALAQNYGNGISLLRDVSRREGISEKYLGQIVIPGRQDRDPEARQERRSHGPRHRS